MQGCEQIGQLKSSSIIDLSDERMRKVVFFALILELFFCDVLVRGYVCELVLVITRKSN